MFIVSNPEMVIASCRAGMVGSFPAHTPRTRETLVEWLDAIDAGLERDALETGEPKALYGVNLVVHHTNERAAGDLDLICERELPLVLTSKGAPGDVFKRIHDYGGVVMHDVASKRHAEKALDGGADALIAVAGGAGGHCGTINPFALMAELRELTDKPIALAGAINSGADILAAEIMGADLAYMGTRFIATTEANADREYQQMILRARSTDVIFTRFHRAPANILAESLLKAGFDLDVLRDRPADGIPDNLEEIKVWRELLSAGHGAGAIHEILTIEEVATKLKAEYVAARKSALVNY